MHVEGGKASRGTRWIKKVNFIFKIVPVLSFNLMGQRPQDTLSLMKILPESSLFGKSRYLLLQKSQS